MLQVPSNELVSLNRIDPETKYPVNPYQNYFHHYFKGGFGDFGISLNFALDEGYVVLNPFDEGVLGLTEEILTDVVLHSKKLVVRPLYLLENIILQPNTLSEDLISFADPNYIRIVKKNEVLGLEVSFIPLKNGFVWIYVVEEDKLPLLTRKNIRQIAYRNGEDTCEVNKQYVTGLQLQTSLLQHCGLKTVEKNRLLEYRLVPFSPSETP